uniref:Uncharacterized protein n=1 Tax=Myoviridae sp. ct5ra14 TaxID=2827659 RepID=A0A8S5T1T2_9CAUD|nr:MAG TPA: hypothetical protein [Myoviridae sp. ct5ra14]DAI77290.1 MAG TPA: hypothetical protein [Caudoviricetes sp.]
MLLGFRFDFLTISILGPRSFLLFRYLNELFNH